MSYIVICKSCDVCRADVAFKITDNYPSENEIEEVRKQIGNGFCITTYISEIKEGEVNVIEKD